MSKRLFSLALQVPSLLVRVLRELKSRGLSHIPLASALGSSPKKPLSPNTGEGSSLSFCPTCGGASGWYICVHCVRIKPANEMADRSTGERYICRPCYNQRKGGKNFQEDKLS